MTRAITDEERAWHRAAEQRALAIIQARGGGLERDPGCWQTEAELIAEAIRERDMRRALAVPRKPVERGACA